MTKKIFTGDSVSPKGSGASKPTVPIHGYSPSSGAQGSTQPTGAGGSNTTSSGGKGGKK